MPFPPIESFLIAVGAGLAGGLLATVLTGGRAPSNLTAGVVVAVLVATLIHG